MRRLRSEIVRLEHKVVSLNRFLSEALLKPFDPDADARFFFDSLTDKADRFLVHPRGCVMDIFDILGAG